MATDKRVFTLRIDDDLYEKLRVIAEKNKRSLNRQIEFLAEQCAEDYEKAYGEIETEKEG